MVVPGSSHDRSCSKESAKNVSSTITKSKSEQHPSTEAKFMMTLRSWMYMSIPFKPLNTRGSGGGGGRQPFFEKSGRLGCGDGIRRCRLCSHILCHQFQPIFRPFSLKIEKILIESTQPPSKQIFPPRRGGGKPKSDLLPAINEQDPDAIEISPCTSQHFCIKKLLGFRCNILCIEIIIGDVVCACQNTASY